MALRSPPDIAAFPPTPSAVRVALATASPVDSPVGTLLPLSELPIGKRGRLLDADASKPDPCYAISTPSRERLRHLGFVPGTEIRVLRRAPFGGPIEFELRGFRICLRPGDLGALRVRLER